MTRSGCTKGHLRVPENTYADGRCKLCLKEQRRLWYINHKVEQDERNKRWRALNPGRQKKLNSQNYYSNIERYREKDRVWTQNNLDKKRLARAKRRAKMKQALICDFTDAQVDDKMRYFGYKCVYCGGKFKEVDHAIPLDRGGPHMIANFVPACKSCNCKKYTKTWKEFINWRGIT